MHFFGYLYIPYFWNTSHYTNRLLLQGCFCRHMFWGSPYQSISLLLSTTILNDIIDALLLKLMTSYVFPRASHYNFQ